MSVDTPRPPARERLLGAADRLFYAEGVCSVGIDRVIAEAGVAKATLYYAFGSKEKLIAAYLERRSLQWREYLDTELDRYTDPSATLLGVFEVLGQSFSAPEFNGCPFINASAEADPGGAVHAMTDAHRAWLHDRFTGLAAQAGARDPGGVAAQLSLIYHGALVAASLDRDPSAGERARDAAAAVLAAAQREPADDRE